MANIYVPNIIITQDYNIINKIMESDYLDLTNQYSEDQAIVLSNRQNKYVYSLEHSISFNESDSKIILKILDVDGNFENQFFSETFFQKLIRTQVDNFIKDKASLPELERYLSSKLNSGIRIYIAYGIGNELANWSNPISCVLMGSKIELSNNGLKSYVYDLRPEVNYFFKYNSVKPDENNLTDNLSLTFGAGSVYTEVSLPLKFETLPNVTLNIKNLLTQFISKITNIPEYNVITLIPNIDRDVTVSSIVETEFQEYKAEEIPDGGGAVAEVTTVAKNFYNFVVAKATPYVEAVPALLRNELAEGDKTFDQLLEELKYTTKWEKVDWGNTESVYKFYTQYFKSLVVSNSEANRTKIKNLKAGKKYVTTPLRQQVLSELAQKTMSKDPDRSSVLINLALISRPDPSKSNDSDSAKLPDWYRTIQNMFLSIANLYKSGNSFLVPYVSYESDAKFLKLFHKHKLIADPKNTCVIIGDRQMILDYIYKNQIPINQILDYKSSFNLNRKDPLYKLLNNRQYSLDLKNLISKKKNSSSFDEKIILDELSYSQETTQLIEQYTKLDDVPVFLNNFKNSNILSYSLNNTENYMTAVRHAVEQNRFKILLSQLNEEDINKFLQAGGIFPEGKLSPKQIAQQIYDKVKTKFKGFNISDENSKISRDLVDVINVQKDLDSVNNVIQRGSKYLTGDYVDSAGMLLRDRFTNNENAFVDAGKAIFARKDKDRLDSLLNKKYEGLSDNDKAFFDFYIKQEADGLIFTNSKENLTLLNIALQAQIAEEFSLPNYDIANLAEVIILMNQSNLVSKNSQVVMTPEKYGPNQSFILAKINDYAMKYFLEISLKTLPFFYLSNQRVIGQPALLYSKKLNISNFSNKDNLDFFSGEYRIVGFKHTITTKECYSEFLLNKQNSLTGQQL